MSKVTALTTSIAPMRLQKTAAIGTQAAQSALNNIQEVPKSKATRGLVGNIAHAVKILASKILDKPEKAVPHLSGVKTNRLDPSVIVLKTTHQG